MIDWWGVASNGLWIAGLSTILAVVSYVHWWAHDQGLTLRQALTRNEFRFPFLIGALLFAVGLLATSRLWWERIGWATVVLLLSWQVYALRRDHITTRGESANAEGDS